MKRFVQFFALFLLSFSLFAQTNVNLLSEAEKNGVSCYWDALGSSGVLEKNGHQIAFHVGDAFVLQDYTKIQFTDAPELQDGTVMVSKKFIDDTFSFFNTRTKESGYKVGAIIIDPGHGGKDPGALATYKINGKSVTIKEKDICLKTANLLCTRLKKAYPDKKIIMTRSTDVFLSLEERTDIANSVKLGEHEAILYVSIHVNSSLDKKATGYETWYLSPDYRRTVLEKDKNVDKNLFNILNSLTEEEYTSESLLIAKFIMDGIQAQVGSLSNQRGIKANDWFVVKNANMPSVLIELGFVSNEAEAKNLIDNFYLQKLSLGIYNGLTAFITHFERSRGFMGGE
ncbi:MAG: N-acetylmuramoyl-L-alanine amidase [Treponema sp.]|nr:N-acetylmuramoyl-L-alanine amidase [Treponema sp.]